MSIQDRINIRFAALGSLLLLTVVGCKPEDEEPEDTYMFAAEEASAYSQIDRHAMPAINVVLIADKDGYNMVGPEATADYVDEMTATVTALHDALDDDIIAAQLVPCAPDVCIAQAAPLVVPDTLKINTGAAAGFPNGRLLTDPVVDVTLAVILLDLSVEGQTVTTLAGVPINPTANDLAFETAFPYVAPAH
jgi:hypothetical protein